MELNKLELLGPRFGNEHFYQSVLMLDTGCSMLDKKIVLIQYPETGIQHHHHKGNTIG